jgi:hypothetical protein
MILTGFCARKARLRWKGYRPGLALRQGQPKKKIF